MSREQSKRTISCPPKCFARRRMIAGIGTSPAVLTETVRALARVWVGNVRSTEGI